MLIGYFKQTNPVHSVENSKQINQHCISLITTWSVYMKRNLNLFLNQLLSLKIVHLTFFMDFHIIITFFFLSNFYKNHHFSKAVLSLAWVFCYLVSWPLEKKQHTIVCCGWKFMCWHSHLTHFPWLITGCDLQQLIQITNFRAHSRSNRN